MCRIILLISVIVAGIFPVYAEDTATKLTESEKNVVQDVILSFSASKILLNCRTYINMDYDEFKKLQQPVMDMMKKVIGEARADSYLKEEPDGMLLVLELNKLDHKLRSMSIDDRDAFQKYCATEGRKRFTDIIRYIRDVYQVN